MSVTHAASTSPPPTPPTAPSQASSSPETSKPQPNEVKAKTGDENAVAQKAARPPLPPGQGTRVDMLV
jgi:hypothetical protein